MNVRKPLNFQHPNVKMCPSLQPILWNWSLSIPPKTCKFIKNVALAQVFSCEFCEISKNTFVYITSLGDCFWIDNYDCMLTFFWSYWVVWSQSYLTSVIEQTLHKNFFVKDFFSRCDQIRSVLKIWSHILKKSLMKNFTQ